MDIHIYSSINLRNNYILSSERVRASESEIERVSTRETKGVYNRSRRRHRHHR